MLSSFDSFLPLILFDNIWRVEIIIGYTDQTWTTSIIGIPADTPYEKIEDVIENEALKLWFDNSNTNKQIAFTKLYNDYVEEENEDE